MVAMVERLNPFEVQEREATGLLAIGLYVILPSNAALFITIDQEEDLKERKFSLLNNSQSTSFTVSSR